MTLPVVCIIDDHESVRRSLARVLSAAGFAVEAFDSAAAFIDRPPSADAPSCLVLDVKMPGLSGLELQARLAAEGRKDPIVFITAHGDVPMCATALKAGAVDFLPKPFTSDALLEAVQSALARAARQSESDTAGRSARERLAKLTARELEVFRLLIAGLLNKQVGAVLGAAEKTIKNHRAHITAKLGVTSVAGMIQLAREAGISPALPPR